MVTVAIALAVILVLMVVGLPMAFSFAVADVVMIVSLGLGFEFAIMAMFYQLNAFVLMAIPFFILAGALMRQGGISERLIAFADSIVGRVKGGLGSVVVLSCMVFGAISGSSVSAVASIGSIMIPRMEEMGYPRRYTTALVSCSGLLGQLIPPSIPVIIYGVVTRTSIAAVFLATVIPGILLGTAYSVINYFSCRKFPIVSLYAGQRFSTVDIAKQIGRTGYKAFFGLLMPVIILGGIYGGIFTPTEAAAVAVVYALPVGFFIYRGFGLRTFARTLVEVGTMCGSLLLIFAFVVVFSRILTMQQVPDMIVSFMWGVSENKYVLILLMNLFLIIVGMIMDDVTGTLLAAPLLMPLVLELGIHPVQFGAILAVNLGLGLMTPPVAANLWVGARVGNLPVSDFMGPVLRFLLLAGLPVLLLTAYIPALSVTLPRLIMGAKVMRY